MGRKNKRKHTKIRSIRAEKYTKGYSSHSSNNFNSINSTYEPAKAKKQYSPHPRRGDIWFARLGNHYDTYVQSGTRPVFIISNDTGNRFSKTYTVLPMTSRLKKPDLPSHVELPGSSCTITMDSPFGDSMILAEQIVTIDKSALLDKIAFVTDEKKLTEIERAVRIHLDLGSAEKTA